MKRRITDSPHYGPCCGVGLEYVGFYRCPSCGTTVRIVEMVTPEAAGQIRHALELAAAGGVPAAPGAAGRRPAPPAITGGAAGFAAGTPMPDREVMTALARLWATHAWHRLDICRTSAGGFAGYCIPAGGACVETAAVLSDPSAYPPGICALADLLASSGWQRFEAMGDPARDAWPHGWCERADGSGLHMLEYLTATPLEGA